MTLAHQMQDDAQDCDIDEELDCKGSGHEEVDHKEVDYEELGYLDLSEIVCHLWECLVTESYSTLVAVSNGYVKELMQADSPLGEVISLQEWVGFDLQILSSPDRSFTELLSDSLNDSSDDSFGWGIPFPWEKDWDTNGFYS